MARFAGVEKKLDGQKGKKFGNCLKALTDLATSDSLAGMEILP